MSNYLENIAEQELNYCKIVWLCLSAALDESELREMIQQRVLGETEYNALPQKNKQYIFGYSSCAIEVFSRLKSGNERAKQQEGPPREISNLQPNATWHKHPNGGGWVSDSAFVDETAKVGAHAVVYGEARVLDRSQVYGSARVGDHATLSGGPHVHGRATILGFAKVFDAARILGEASLSGTVEVGGRAVVRGNVSLSGSEQVMDRTVGSNDEVSGRKKGASGIFSVRLDSKAASR